MAVMVNSNELLDYPEGVESAIGALFGVKNNSLVDIVRVATYAADVTKCKDIVRSLSQLGYRVFLNLMQVDALNLRDLGSYAEEISSWDCVETLYFADSFGGMEPETVEAIVNELARCWSGKLGIHAHDNKGHALSNCIAALKCGVDYLDGTLTGMGRGAGNAKTENLLVELTQRGCGKYFPDAVFPLALQDFERMRKEYNWGTNIYYFMSAVYGIHPSYIQELLGGGIYDSEQILSAIQFLSSKSASFYSLETLLASISGVNGDMSGEWSASKWIHGREVMIVGAGDTTSRHMSTVLNYIKTHDPVVLCLNVNDDVPKDVVTAYVACHETRILIEADKYSTLDRPIIMPKSRLIHPILDSMDNIEIYDYGLCIDDGELEITDNGCTISKPLAGLYAIAVSIAANASRILLVGMDGYKEHDYRQKEMVSMFKKFEQHNVPIMAVTPTSYPVTKRSIYERDL